MANTQIKLRQLIQDGAAGTNDYIKWDGSNWAASTLDSDLVALAALSSNGYIARTGTGAFSARTFSITNDVASTAQLAIGGGDGSSNTIISIQTDTSTLKMSVEAATTANITLSGTQTVDGIVLSAGNRCLVKNQSTGANNGIYEVASGSWTRSTDYNTSGDAEHGLVVFVQGGTTNGNKFFRVDQSKPTIGTTALTFTEVLTDSDGIYSGSGIIPSSTVATITSSSSFSIAYNGGADALSIDDSVGTTLYSKLGTSSIGVGNGGVIIEGVSGVAVSASPYFSISGGTAAGELRLVEPSAGGSSYTGFKAPALAADLLYVLPTTATNGYFLKYNSSGNQLEWAAAAGDGNGIYTGSGTVPASTVATITSTSTFDIDYAGGNPALSIDDADTGTTIWSKDNASFVYVSNTGTLIESNVVSSIAVTSGNALTLSSTEAQFAGPVAIAPIGGAISIDATAILQLDGVTGGLLLNRLTTTERNALTSVPDGLLLYNTTTDALTIRANGAWVELGAGSGGLSDADYGDITVSGTGTVMTIDNDVVTYAKMQNVSATARIMGRNTAGAGDMEELTASTVKTMLSLNNVENTALSTWAGSANITTLGTIATGSIPLSRLTNGTFTSALAGTVASSSTFRVNFNSANAGLIIDDTANTTTIGSDNGANYVTVTDTGVDIFDIRQARLIAAPTTDTTVSGTVITLTANENQVFGDVCYINASGEAQLGDASAIGTAVVSVMCTETVTANNPAKYLLMGIARRDAWSWTVGGVIYLSTTGTSTNTLTQTKPTGTGDIIQIVGIATHADRMIFKPDLTTIQLT